jgi:hypothetical protein
MKRLHPPGTEHAATISEWYSKAGKAGAFLILTALLTGISALSRVASDTDRTTAVETLEAIFAAPGPYALSGASRLASGITLMLAASFLLRTWIIRKRHAPPLVPRLLVISGAVTALSGLAAVFLVISGPDANLASSNPDLSKLTESILLARWFTGNAGFALAGIALVVASPYLWKAGRLLRHIIGPASAIVGAAMQLIWIDSATMVHRIVGAAFLVWALAIGGMLVTGRIEKQFSSTRSRLTV